MPVRHLDASVPQSFENAECDKIVSQVSAILSSGLQLMGLSKNLIHGAKADRSQTLERSPHPVSFRYNPIFLPSRFLSGSRAWKFRERFGS
jgi:hypothetical protein